MGRGEEDRDAVPRRWTGGRVGGDESGTGPVEDAQLRVFELVLEGFGGGRGRERSREGRKCEGCDNNAEISDAEIDTDDSFGRV